MFTDHWSELKLNNLKFKIRWSINQLSFWANNSGQILFVEFNFNSIQMNWIDNSNKNHLNDSNHLNDDKHISWILSTWMVQFKSVALNTKEFLAFDKHKNLLLLWFPC